MPQAKDPICLARELFQTSQKISTWQDRIRAQKMKRLLQNKEYQHFITHFIDLLYRAPSNRTTSRALCALKAPNVGFKMLQELLKVAPHIFVPLLKKMVYHELKSVLGIPKSGSARINLNHLGEAILGEQEATHRMQLYSQDLENPRIDFISIKVSTLYSQIQLIDWDHTLEVLSERLKTLYRKAKNTVVMLDMEEYKDLELTVALFTQVLEEQEFIKSSHGIVLQSYLPDSFEIQKQLIQWAKARIQRGGAPIHMRLVKGANLSSEKVESALRLWPLAPFSTKLETDAQFKKMLRFGIERENVAAVHLGVASHNLFDISYALYLRSQLGVEKFVRMEMLKGMSPPLQRVVEEVSQNMLLYCPEAISKDLHYAAPYLMRRLDENTAPDNFLRHLFDLKLDNDVYQIQLTHFLDSLMLSDHLECHKNRTQNRLEYVESRSAAFINESDTDFSLKENRVWADKIYQEWEHKELAPLTPYCEIEKALSALKNDNLSFGFNALRFKDHFDEGLHQPSETIAKGPLLSEERSGWCKDSRNEFEYQSVKPKTQVDSVFPPLQKAADLFRKERGALIGVMMKEGNKVFEEADIEVSEAIDFIEYYAHQAQELAKISSWKPLGTVLAAPPWNFPCSIAVGNIAASLAMGNCVLFKPAPEAVFVGRAIADLFYKAGFSKEVLQFVPCPDVPYGTQLILDARVDAVLLTGATSTAQMMRQKRPSLNVMAETGGKNAMIITSLADRDLALSDLLKSAFGHAGQKCSACSLAILEAPLYDDPHFLAQLKNAAESLKVGSQWDKGTKIPPLIKPPSAALKKALTTLEEGESWLLEPHVDPCNPSLISPGIKLGVKKGSFMHQTELFGPVLAVMRAQNLCEAIDLANSTPYGLTSGLHSLAEEEKRLWKENIIAGNLYINRTTTGAIVQRQPFGGTKASSFGRGAKAGGPNYLTQLAVFKDQLPPVKEIPLPPALIPLIQSSLLQEDEMQIWKRCAQSYASYAEEFKTPHDVSQVLGQDNFFYLVPRTKVTLRIEEGDSTLDLCKVIAACLCAKTPLEISVSTFFPNLGVKTVVETSAAFLQRVSQKKCPTIRLIHSPSPELQKIAAEHDVLLLSGPPLSNGRFELLNYLREVSLSHTTHRYGFIY